MKTLITVMPVNSQLTVVGWSIFRVTKYGAPGGFIGRIDAVTKEAAETIAKILYGENIVAEIQPHDCPHCGQLMPCSGSTWGCLFPQGDGTCPLP